MSSLQFSWGSIFVLLACVCWGLENNCTRALSFIIGERFYNVGFILLALLLGFIAYGLSIYFYIYAQRDLGAAKTSTYYAISPFIGAGLSLLIFREIPSAIFIFALIIMATGTYYATVSES